MNFMKLLKSISLLISCCAIFAIQGMEYQFQPIEPAVLQRITPSLLAPSPRILVTTPEGLIHQYRQLQSPLAHLVLPLLVDSRMIPHRTKASVAI